MTDSWEYKVVPAPAKGTKAKGVKAAEDRFALSIENVLNEMAADGWSYVRAELLPSQERSGLTSTSTEWRNLLIFKRSAAAFDEPEVVDILEPPVIATAATSAVVQDEVMAKPDEPTTAEPEVVDADQVAETDDTNIEDMSENQEPTDETQSDKSSDKA